MMRSNTLAKPQIAIMILIVTVTSKLCFLPSALAETNGASAVWSVVLLIILDGISALFSIKIAAKGGLNALPQSAKKCLAAPLSVIILFKFCAFSFEISIATADALFDSPVVIPLFTLLTVGVLFVASKGFFGVTRTALLALFDCGLLLIFNLFFMGIDGSSYNLFPLIHPNGVFDGFASALIWFGDPCLFLLIEASDAKGKTRGFVGAFFVSVLTIVGFYLLLLYTYGSSLEFVGAAFSRVLLMNKNASEIGALDWPMMTVWLTLGFFHCCLLFSAFNRCLECMFEESNIVKAAYIIVPLVSYLLYFFVFKNKDSYLNVLTDLAVAIPIGVIEYLTPMVASVAMKLKKGNKNEKEALA